MKQLIMVGLPVVIAGVLVQWGHVMVGVVLGIAATIMILCQRNKVDIEEFYKGKSVILTGASKGIGKSMAIQLAQLGAKLVIAARSEDKLAETQHLCQEHTSHVHTVVADVSREEDCKAIVEKAVEEFGGVDILILNAAYSVAGQWFTEYKKPGEFYSNVFGVNLLQSVYLVQHALPYLTTSKGTIVPVSSGSAIVSMPKFSAYSTSKHALHGFFKCLHQEFIFTNTPVAITIMPLPYVLTNQAVEGFKPIGAGGGITSEDCAARMIHGIPLGKRWYYIDWTTFIISHLYSLCPAFFDFFVRFHLRRNSHLFSQI